ncbi:type II toxin-antitoxin system RelB family antitoxin [Gordonibacter sp.]|uniref:type II toxin-antitoxin system RelB family antitoxin n=1 Tax=Gordonibacter sp. TaxID=1968902 RepID=UPI002FC76EE3
MAMTASAIRFAPEEKEWITSFAEMNGNTFSSQVRKWALERLEDEMDARDLAQALKDDDGERIEWDTAKRNLELAL